MPTGSTPQGKQHPNGTLTNLQHFLKLRNDPSSASYGDIIFVCVDCEAFEFDQSKITEVGISVLDTRHVNSNTTVESWFPHIVSSHYRIEEYGHLRNRRFAKGNPDGFAFGQSTWVRQAAMHDVLTEIFCNPRQLSGPDPLGHTTSIVVVGHSLANDVAYLKRLHFDLGLQESVVLRMDTQSIATTKQNYVSLKKLLATMEVRVPPSQLHNAGNDARYTLQALLLTAVKEMISPGSTQATVQEKFPRKRSSLGAQ